MAAIFGTLISLSFFLLTALLSLALLAGLPAEVAAQDPVGPVVLEYPQSNPNGRVEEGDAIEFTVRRLGDTSQELTVNVRIDGKTDTVVTPPRFNATHDDDFDSSQTTSSVTFAPGSTGSRTLIVQTRDDTVYEPHEYFDVIASGNYGGAGFEVRLEGFVVEDDRPTVHLMHADPFKITEGDSGTVTLAISQPVPHSVPVGYSVMSRHRTSTEVIGDGGATMADHEVRPVTT